MEEEGGVIYTAAEVAGRLCSRIRVCIQLRLRMQPIAGAGLEDRVQEEILPRALCGYCWSVLSGWEGETLTGSWWEIIVAAAHGVSPARGSSPGQRVSSARQAEQ